ncbi:F27F5.17 [Arabidopsis lyrata subsp. lyrata]|uniref:F27F5.17 n=1 Tax=Arabidopsis lyrata subsp. lyrata TaxID=81972 RepID=D7MAR8_ARALL|nr:F27F5.17 [Arabidopsis lyrata subsp. lyrata]
MESSSKESAAKVLLLGKRKPEDDPETKPILRKHKETSEEKETTEGFACSLQQNSEQDNLTSAKAASVTLFVSGLSRQTKISDIIDFFSDVGEVVHVRICITHEGRRLRSGFVEFTSASEANKAMEKKNGEYLHDQEISLRVAQTTPYRPPKNHDSFQLESLPIEEDETPLDFVEEVVIVSNLSPQTKIAHIKGFFNDVAEVVSVRLVVNHEGKHVGYGFVEFASAYGANKALEEKNGDYLHDHQILLMRGHESPGFVEEAAITKTLFVANLCDTIKISDIINFFKDVGEVVHVRLVVNSQGKHAGWGFVEFASANEAEKALVKNGEYLHNYKISLDVAKTAPYRPPKFCLDHKVWYEDYLRRESLLIKEDEAVEGLDETPDFLEEAAARKKTLFVANLPYSCRRIVPTIINFFKDVGEIVHVRIIVDHMGVPVGCGFVEFNSSNEAEKALQKKNGQYSKISVDVAEIALYPVGPKYNVAKKLWYEDNLRRGRLLIKEKTEPDLKKPSLMSLCCGQKVTFSDDD